MDVRRYQDPGEFRASVSPLFRADPVRHTLALTVMDRFLPVVSEPVMVSFHERSRLVGALFRTPPWPLVVSGLPLDGLRAAVDVLLDVDPRLPGVTGPRDRVEPFARLWSGRTGQSVREVMAGRLYALGDLTPPVTPGCSRLATEDDLPVLVSWRVDFQVEATGGERDPGDSEPTLRRAMAMGDGLLLWEVDGTPVAWANASAPIGGPIGGMSRIGPVYTPPAHRGRGYGSAVTAAASRWARHAGAEHVLLFTDLANPTSNSIYQKLGYRQVYDSAELEFVPLPSNP